MKKFVFITILFLFTMPAHATTPLNYDLAKRAVTLSASVDAYGAYCEKPSKLGDEYIQRFEDVKLPKEKLKELKGLQKDNFDTTLAYLKLEKKTCKDVNLLLKRLEIMRSLKDVSYELNGVDPKTVKDNIPPLELLMPDEMPDISLDEPPQPLPEVLDE